MGLGFKTLALSLFLICLGCKIKHKNVFSLRSMDHQIVLAKKTNRQSFFFFFFFKGKGTVHRIKHFRKDQRPQSTCVLVKQLLTG